VHLWHALALSGSVVHWVLARALRLLDGFSRIVSETRVVGPS
jgi:hypothetical protein